MTLALIIGVGIAAALVYGLWMADQLGLLSLWPRSGRRGVYRSAAERTEDFGASAKSRSRR